jgi:cell filamentation protein
MKINGVRIARLLSTLMALQAGLPLLDFSSIAGAERTNYFAAVKAGIDRNYAQMCAILLRLFRRHRPRENDLLVCQVLGKVP